jgi:uncharacterized protein YgbK (DUF1537 family)
MGIGSEGKIYRLDRHPSMCKHPVTPSDESDLRLHLAKQTEKKIGLVDILQLGEENKIKNALAGEIKNGNEIVLFDAVHEDQLKEIGKLIDSYADGNDPLFSVGSSGIEMALGNHWKENGDLKKEQAWKEPLPTESLLVVSGSCSPVTSAQIAWALKNGFAEIKLNISALAAGDPSSMNEIICSAIKYINDKQSLIVHTNCNEEIADQKGTAKIFGNALGTIVKAVAEKTSLERIVIAGGDTSSYAARAMGIEAVEMMAPLSPGAPLCKAYAPGSPVDGLEVNFKGGQVGKEDYFGRVKEGK